MGQVSSQHPPRRTPALVSTLVPLNLSKIMRVLDFNVAHPTTFYERLHQLDNNNVLAMKSGMLFSTKRRSG